MDNANTGTILGSIDLVGLLALAGYSQYKFAAIEQRLNDVESAVSHTHTYVLQTNEQLSTYIKQLAAQSKNMSEQIKGFPSLKDLRSLQSNLQRIQQQLAQIKSTPSTPHQFNNNPPHLAYPAQQSMPVANTVSPQAIPDRDEDKHLMAMSQTHDPTTPIINHLNSEEDEEDDDSDLDDDEIYDTDAINQIYEQHHIDNRAI